MSDDDAFLSRWSRRKALARDGLPVAAEPAPPAAAVPAVATALAMPAAATPPAEHPAAAAVAEPPPTLDDVAALTRESDYTRFVARGVAPDVKNAALKKLFTDPHFNVMDGLDTYIDDYGRPDPLPPGMLEMMVQSRSLGLFDAPPAEPTVEPPADAPAVPPAASPPSEAAAPAPAPSLDPAPPTHQANLDEDPDLRLQPDPAARPAGVAAGAVDDARRQH